MKPKKNVPWVITIISLIIGFMLAIQFQSSKPAAQGESKDISQLRQDYQKLMEHHQRILSDISKYDQLLNQYKNSMDQANSLQVMKDELNRIKSLGGYSPMEGPGIILTIDEADATRTPGAGGENGQADLPDSLKVIYDDDLRYVINEMFGAGARAISINGHRITTTTAVRTVGDKIQVDTKIIQLPFEIRVIGDPDVLESAIKLKGFEEYFAIVNKKIVLKKLDKVVIPAYDGKESILYMKPLKEGS